MTKRHRATTRIAALAAVPALALAACNGENGGEETAGENGNGEACDIAEGFPSGPVELIVPWAAGGGTDGVARILGSELSSALGTQVNVVNRDGGAGVVGHQAIADANPDGRTIGLVTAEIAMMHWQGLTGLTHEDLTPISLVNQDSAGITVADDAPWQDAQELLDDIESRPGDIAASGTAQGGIWHVALIGMLVEAGLEPDAVNWVPSDGAAPALQDLMAGGVDLSTSSLGENVGMLESGQVRALATMGEGSDPSFPDVPTLEEATGLDFALGTWRGIAGPAGMDEDVVAELECHLENITASEEFEQFMTDSRFGIEYRDADGFAEHLVEADTQMGELLDVAGLTE